MLAPGSQSTKGGRVPVKRALEHVCEACDWCEEPGSKGSRTLLCGNCCGALSEPGNTPSESLLTLLGGRRTFVGRGSRLRVGLLLLPFPALAVLRLLL